MASHAGYVNTNSGSKKPPCNSATTRNHWQMHSTVTKKDANKQVTMLYLHLRRIPTGPWDSRELLGTPRDSRWGGESLWHWHHRFPETSLSERLRVEWPPRRDRGVFHHTQLFALFRSTNVTQINDGRANFMMCLDDEILFCSASMDANLLQAFFDLKMDFHIFPPMLIAEGWRIAGKTH